MLTHLIAFIIGANVGAFLLAVFRGGRDHD